MYSHAECKSMGAQRMNMPPWTAGHVVAADEIGDTVEAGPTKRMKVAVQ